MARRFYFAFARLPIPLYCPVPDSGTCWSAPVALSKIVNVEDLAPFDCGAKTILSLHFFFGKRFWGQVVAPEGNPNSCGLVAVTMNAGLPKVIGDPFFAVLLSVNVNVLA